MPAVGGLGTAIGPVLGSLLITPLSELLRSYLGHAAAGLHLVIYSAALIVVMLYFPGGHRRCACDASERVEAPIVTPHPRSPSSQPQLRRAVGSRMNVSFEVAEGELLGLIGPNGAGKSTLYNLIAGALKPTARQDRIRPGRTSPTGHRIGSPVLGIARTFQIPKPYRQLSVVENVMLTAFQHERSVAGARRLAEATLADVELADYAGAPVGTLTVGLLKRLEVARALALRPKLVLFDEIMAGLTPTEVGAMTKFVASLPARGITVIWVEHVLYAIMKTASRIIVLNRGEVIANGPAAAVARDPAVVKAYLGEEMDLA